MRARLPLYGKILVWFFLNLVLLAAVFVLLFHAQFSFNLDWFLAGGARERLEAVRNLIVGELNSTAPDEWESVIDRYSEAYRVRFALLDDDANPLLGDVGAIPAEVRERILAPPTFPGARPSATPRERSTRFRFRPPMRALMRTSNPTLYWLITSARVDNALAGDPMRVMLIARSTSISAGGLVFDPKPWMWLGLAAVVFSLLFWFPLVRGITRSLAQITQATRRIADGRFDVRVETGRHDELGQVGDAVNDMAARLDGFVSGQKRFLGGVAHELCSPLARLQMALGVLDQRVTPEQSQYVKSASEKAEQMAALINELLSFSKASFGASAVHLQPVKVREACEEAVRREECPAPGVSMDIPADLAVAADRDLLVRAIANLLRNAVRHAGQAGPIELQARRDGGEVAIRVADSGPGVAEEELPKIFDAFYRVDDSRDRQTGGAGLGLTIVKACIESCAGTVTARNRKPHGLEVSIHLPLVEP